MIILGAWLVMLECLFLPENVTPFSFIPTCGTELLQEGYQLQLYLWGFFLSFKKKHTHTHKTASGNPPSLRHPL